MNKRVNKGLNVGADEQISVSPETDAAGEIIRSSVKEITVEEWLSSAAARIAAHGEPNYSVRSEPDRDSALVLAVGPIAQKLLDQFGGSDLAVVVTDRAQFVVGRWTADAAIAEVLDDINVMPGSLFEEGVVGVTRAGSVHETDANIATIGMESVEQYTKIYDTAVVAGAPIINPSVGEIEGVLHIVAPTGTPAGLMAPLVARAAREAGERLIAGFAREDKELLDAFIRTERRGSRRPMIAVNRRMLIVNGAADAMMTAISHERLWHHVEDAILAGRDVLEVEANGDAPLFRALIRRVTTNPFDPGVVIQPGVTTSVVRRSSFATIRRQNDPIPGLVGESLRWMEVVRDYQRALASQEPLLISGPPGTGKSALAVSLARALVERPDVVAIVNTELINGDGLPRDVRVILIDELSADVDWSLLAHFTTKAHAAGQKVIGILRTEPEEDVADVFAQVFSRVIKLPSLAHRPSDIPRLIGYWERDRGRAVNGGAVRELTLRYWRANVRELFQTLDLATGDRRCAVKSADLPSPAVRTPARSLSYLEHVEREAIAMMLDEMGGRKIDLARELGISRSTLYRKLVTLGLDE